MRCVSNQEDEEVWHEDLFDVWSMAGGLLMPCCGRAGKTQTRLKYKGQLK